MVHILVLSVNAENCVCEDALLKMLRVLNLTLAKPAQLTMFSICSYNVKSKTYYIRSVPKKILRYAHPTGAAVTSKNVDFYVFSLLAEADLGMFSMFGRTGAPQKGSPHRSEIVGRQHDIFWPVGWGLFMPYCDI